MLFIVCPSRAFNNYVYIPLCADTLTFTCVIYVCTYDRLISLCIEFVKVAYDFFLALACRETILRLVSEAKKHEGQAVLIEDLERSVDEMKGLVAITEREKKGLEERLMAAKETLLAQEKELQSKETK